MTGYDRMQVFLLDGKWIVFSSRLGKAWIILVGWTFPASMVGRCFSKIINWKGLEIHEDLTTALAH